VPREVKAEKGWLAFEVIGPLDFDEVGIVASIADPLRDAGVSIFVISAYDTDYVLVRDAQLSAAMDALNDAGFSLSD